MHKGETCLVYQERMRVEEAARIYAEEQAHHNRDDQESTKTVKEITKPCPKCGVRIEKSEGCDHMTCMILHTVTDQ